MILGMSGHVEVEVLRRRLVSIPLYPSLIFTYSKALIKANQALKLSLSKNASIYYQLRNLLFEEIKHLSDGKAIRVSIRRKQ